MDVTKPKCLTKQELTDRLKKLEEELAYVQKEYQTMKEEFKKLLDTVMMW